MVLFQRASLSHVSSMPYWVHLGLNAMNVIDVPNHIGDAPDGRAIISDKTYIINGIIIRKVELRHYITGQGTNGPYSVITAYVQFESDSVEILYDQGYRGKDALDRAARFLRDMMGISGLVLRAQISLTEHKQAS